MAIELYTATGAAWFYVGSYSIAMFYQCARSVLFVLAARSTIAWKRRVKDVIVYTDGSCHGNPGPGGYAAVLKHNGHRRELSAGYHRTTNNRMELRAAIAALRALKEPCRVTIHTDSKYMLDSVTKGWVLRWRDNGWWKGKRLREPVANFDLWEELLPLLEPHDVRWVWVKGHAGDEENERCDLLANAAAAGDGKQQDEGYGRRPPRVKGEG